MAWVGIVLEYLKVLLSASVIFGGITLTALLLFKKEIRELIGRIASIKFGGAELSTPQSSKLPEDDKKPLPAPSSEEIENIPQGLDENERRAVTQAILSHMQTARLWEYRYLNVFLVKGTQLVLDWLVKLNKTLSVAEFDSLLLPHIPSFVERQAIFTVLESHQLITNDTKLGTITVTEKGKEYRQWRGELPPIPPANQSN